jgi:serine acetyltransferase
MESMLRIPIPAEAALGPGLRIHHFGGIIAHSKAVAREDSTHYHGVTLGGLGGWGGTPPVGYHILVKHTSFPWSLGSVACISMQKTFMY